MEKLEVVRGSGNVFKDLGLANADVELMRAKLAAGIIAIMRKRNLTPAKAASLAKVTVADISRIRSADLGRFTIDRLVRILNSLGQHVDVQLGAYVKAQEAGRLSA